MEPVERVLERAGDRALVKRAAPEQPVRRVTGLDQPRGRLARVVVIRVVHGQVEFAQIEQLRLGSCGLGALQRLAQGGPALRDPRQRAAEPDDCQPLRNAHCS